MGVTVIDALVVTLGLDDTKFKKGQKDSNEALIKFRKQGEDTHKKMTDQTKSLVDGYKKIRNELVAITAIFLSANGLKNWVSNTVHGEAALGRLAKNLNMSGRALDAWGAVAESVGGKADDVRKSLSVLTDESQNVTLGRQTELTQWLAGLGVNILDASGKAKKGVDLYKEVLNQMHGLSSEKQVIAAGLLGFGQTDIELARLSSTERELRYKKGFSSSGVTEESIKKAQEAEAKWAEFQRTMRGVAQTIFESIQPALSTVNELLLDFAKWVASHKTEIAQFFKDAATAIADIAKWLSDNKSAAAWGAGILVAASALSTLAGIVSGLVGAGGLPALIALMGGVAAGTAANSWINEYDKKNGTNVGGTIGEWSAKTMAFLGSEEAKLALKNNGAAGYGTQSVSGKIIKNNKVKSSSTAIDLVAEMFNRGEGGYNSVNRGKSGGYASGTEDLTNMTIGEVMAAQKSGKFNAAGHYQVIAGTLAAAVTQMGLSTNQKFDKTTQDRIFEHLIKTKRPEIDAFLNGKGSKQAAILGFAKEWASFADPRTGKTFYNDGINKATISASETSIMLDQMRNKRLGIGGVGGSQVETNIAQITINTQAKDAASIAGTIAPAIKSQNIMVGAL